MNKTAVPAVATTERASVIRLSLGRGVLAIGWASAFAVVSDTLGPVAVALLVAYPLIDAVSSLIDHGGMPDGPERRVTALNGTLSAVVAVALGLAGALGGAGAVLGVFGAWAVVSGAAQLVVGLRRRGPVFGKQWPTLISGGLSFLVGLTYLAQAAGDSPSLHVLSVYATGGGVFFVAQAALLAWKSRQGSEIH
ncbi:DUF308 domain-containing protein [Nocardia asteroides NBRC 15531]|uniref:Integral membrane protein n=1 Tax=Nocardia asteroides NBRC 15531 TaxID=1110697 RepID=U5EFJ0_NOCAS|nr:hypothetical protein [Nocardia asteroides]TLF69862.1 DUF308 domain-containing protein [Nocardia asteroides NBRC 15531]UGT49366.1 DUF308 domain-containing protein [Nocardia asteroides]SFL87994.1 hypothetical protein SAMN05444423_1011265 [Nocardia asteroides]VEG38165.1 Uncharacterized conserved protein [Nocardia asteroides]GAD83959.1 hypothetical protein NCAST_20_05290 [Nocardia asteroides NBRC 15531]